MKARQLISGAAFEPHTRTRTSRKLHKYKLQQLTASRDRGAHCLTKNVTGQVPADD